MSCVLFMQSVNLKPAVATRPSIQTGPRTDLRVAAILEKANTIRMVRYSLSIFFKDSKCFQVRFPFLWSLLIVEA